MGSIFGPFEASTVEANSISSFATEVLLNDGHYLQKDEGNENVSTAAATFPKDSIDVQRNRAHVNTMYLW